MSLLTRRLILHKCIYLLGFGYLCCCCYCLDNSPGRQEELTAHLMGHTEPKLARGLKMKAFYESPYGDDVVTELMNAQVRPLAPEG